MWHWDISTGGMHDYEQSVGYYKKALDLNLSVPHGKPWGQLGFIPLYLGQGTPRYNEEVKLVQDKFFDIVNRMDFSTQEKIYYRLALVEKDKKNWNEAVSLLKQAQERTSTAEARRGYDIELAEVYKKLGKGATVDSLRVEVLKSSRPKLRASVYKDIYREMQAKGFEREAALYMQHYINELELLFTSGSRAELLEIERNMIIRQY